MCADHARRRLPLNCVWWACALAAPLEPALAFTPDQPIQEMSDKADVTRDPEAQAGRASGHQLLIVPIPMSNPTLGTGLTLTAALFYNPTQEPEPWISGAGIMKTSNGSWAAGAVHKMSLGQDRFRFAAFAGYGDFRMDFYGIGPAAGDRGLSIALEEEGFAALAQAQIRLAPSVYAGGRLLYLDLDTRIDAGDSDPRFPNAEIPALQFESRMVLAGPLLSYDRRDSSLNPTNGEFASAAWMFGVPSLGSDFSHDKFTLNANLYRPLGPNTVIAARGALCGASSGTPYYDLCMYGSSNDLRGYETGRYRDRASWAIQYELRQHLFGRFGAVAFAGIGGTAPGLSRLDDTTFLPAAGVGIRYMASRQNRVNVRLDFAVGDDSHALYFSIGEAF